MNETVGQRLRRLRQERGLTERDLELPGLSYAYVSRIETGGRNPSLRTIRKLAWRLRVTPLYLETGRDDVDCPHCGRSPNPNG